jgi:hypothetical protein
MTVVEAEERGRSFQESLRLSTISCPSYGNPPVIASNQTAPAPPIITNNQTAPASTTCSSADVEAPMATDNNPAEGAGAPIDSELLFSSFGSVTTQTSTDSHETTSTAQVNPSSPVSSPLSSPPSARAPSPVPGMVAGDDLDRDWEEEWMNEEEDQQESSAPSSPSSTTSSVEFFLGNKSSYSNTAPEDSDVPRFALSDDEYVRSCIPLTHTCFEC